MDSSRDDNLRQHLVAERDKFKQKMLEDLLELYFLRNNGHMCDYSNWSARERYLCLITSQTRDDVITSDAKFSQLLNLPEPPSSPATTIGHQTVKMVENVPTANAAKEHHERSHKSSSSVASNDRLDLGEQIRPPLLRQPTTLAPLTSGSHGDKQQAKEHEFNMQPTASSQESFLSPEELLKQQESHHEDKSSQDSSSEPKDDVTSDAKFSQLLNLPEPPSSPDTTIGHQAMKMAESSPTANVAKERHERSQKSAALINRIDLGEQIRPPLLRQPTTLAAPTSGSYSDKRQANGNEFSMQQAASSQDSFMSPEERDQLLKQQESHQESKSSQDSSSELGDGQHHSPTRISRVVDPIVTPSAVSIEIQNKQMFERAKHEATVTARIAELRKQGLWSAKRLPKVQEPPRPKTHWDYLLEEMRWLSTDFEAERKWKRKAAKKCALMVYRYHQEKRSKIERAEKEHLQHIKKLASTQAKEVRAFWSSIEKIVDFRQQTKLEETRKKAWGLHLNYILDQTSKISNNCLEETPQVDSQDTKMETEDNMEVDYLNSQDGENTEKEPVINNEEHVNKNKHEVDDIAAGAESIQPKGNTLETTTVSTKIPFLLKHNLREYQHIGLDWLVAMYNKKLNGILADEMGLGKTIQTIALLAHLACDKGDWGPHLIVVPTSVMLNWEMEIKKWCPAFKILTYYGNPKERRTKRVGWSRPNSFHICITSYRIVIQDHAAFRRKKWCYFILDEAHYIKNFKSQRWQMLLNFNSQRRLLLTGTPLQNDLMELWSLMHFLMPNLFDSYREFKDWFVNPLTGMIEGSHEYNQELVQRLHKILRPFLLRRLKADVEKQLPRKREFIKTCKLSKRQRFLYEEFMSLSKTKETLASGNFLSVINVLMQLRKVCNHPNLFEPRPTVSPFMMGRITYKIPGLVTTPLDYEPQSNINIVTLKQPITNLGEPLTLPAYQYIRKNFVKSEKFFEDLHEDSESDSSSQRTVEDIQVVDDTIEALTSSQVIAAYNKMKAEQRVERRKKLQLLSRLNEERCKRTGSLYFRDLPDIVELNSTKRLIATRDDSNVFSNGNGRILCNQINKLRSNPRDRLNYLTTLSDEAIKLPEQRVKSMDEIIKKFVFCVPGVHAHPISLHVSHYKPSKKMQEVYLRQFLYQDLSPRFDCLNKIMTNMRTSFPELRLIEYDCGKLQTLSRLLNELKSQDHRVLIFTQMSRMLDILEQFLNHHGHTYLRLDGATKIDQRQILMERFNNDRRIFCFILSTRSGGIGVNLTGADTVIFYDSDWNPTMDAQAQDRCHRIGQTRDVHIYRLISEDTIERNIFMKAQQKRMLGDLAIEEGNFNTSCFKRQAIQELFNVEPSQEPIEVDKVIEVNGRSNEMSKAELIKLEQALSKGEAEAGEDMDVDAIKVARADVDTDLREFDESIPITEESSPVEKSEKEQQIDTLVSQMTKVEQYAVKFLESLQKPKNKEELEQAEKEYRQELENKKSQWEQSRVEMLKEQTKQQKETNETMLTYPRDAKCERVHYLLDGERKVEDMPLWAPPTPPTSPPSPVEENNQYHYQPAMTPAMAARINAMGGLGNIFGFGNDSNKQDTRHFIDEKDLYVDYTAHFLYEPKIMLESQMPPVNQSYTDSEATSYTIGTKKIRLTGAPVLPPNYFQTPTQLPHLQQHLQNLTNIPSTPDGSISGISVQQTVRKPKVRRDEVICLPKSIFDRQTPNFAKIRRELKLQKLRCVTKGNDSDPFAMQKFFHSFSINPLGQSLQQETIVSSVNRQMQQFNNNPTILLAYHQDQLPAWTIQEEWVLLMVLQHLQDLPVNLCILTPGHTPNWELVSEVISDVGFTQRSFKMCEYHFALNVQKREMTRDSSWDDGTTTSNLQSQATSTSGDTTNSSQQPTPPPTKKSKKMKQQQQAQLQDGQQSSQQSTSSKSTASAPAVPFKLSKTGAMLLNDKSLSVSFSERYELIQRIRQGRPKTSRPRYGSRDRLGNQPPPMIRDDKKMIDYERPLKPETVVMEFMEERRRRLMAHRAAQAAAAQAAAAAAAAAAVNQQAVLAAQQQPPRPMSQQPLTPLAQPQPQTIPPPPQPQQVLAQQSMPQPTPPPQPMSQQQQPQSQQLQPPAPLPPQAQAQSQPQPQPQTQPQPQPQPQQQQAPPQTPGTPYNPYFYPPSK